MIPGPDIVIACPHCGALSRVFSLISGNTCGASHWTDGKMIAPMLPEPPQITKCHHCEAIYWTAEANTVGELSLESSIKDPIPESWSNAPRIEELSESEYYEAIERGLGDTPEKEKHLRILAWWRSNDPFRKPGGREDVSAEKRSSGWIENLNALFNFLDKSDQKELLMKAEITREMGNFEAALELLKDVTDHTLHATKTRIEELCTKGLSTPARIGN